MPAAPPLRTARVRVPASTSNLGAGFDCIGLALDRHLTATFSPGPGPLVLERLGTLAHVRTPAERDLLLGTFRERLREADAPTPTGSLTVDSAIPVARGLGSSAAAVVAGLALADAALGRGASFDRDAALQTAAAREGHADNAAPALLGGLVAVAWDERGYVRSFRLPLFEPVAFAFAAPGVEIATRDARDALPRDVPHAMAARALGRTAALVHGLATGEVELLRIGFADELHLPYRLPLVPGGEAALRAAVEAGAWTATISGSGSGLIAIAPPERASAAADAMADALGAAAGGAGVVAFVSGSDRRGTVIEEPAG